jgi:hypothetical protein
MCEARERTYVLLSEQDLGVHFGSKTWLEYSVLQAWGLGGNE